MSVISWLAELRPRPGYMLASIERIRLKQRDKRRRIVTSSSVHITILGNLSCWVHSR